MNKKAQVWVETVIYTLIALSIIAATLAFVKPKIQEIQDKTVVEQSIEIMEYIDQVIGQIIRGGAGNTRIVDVGIKKGSLYLDGETDSIVFEIENSRNMYSEPGTEIPSGNVVILTEKKGDKLYDITLKLDYSMEYDLQFSGEDKLKTLSKSSTPYKILFDNEGGRISYKDTNVNGMVDATGGDYSFLSDIDIVPNPIYEDTYSDPYKYKIMFSGDPTDYYVESADDDFMGSGMDYLLVTEIISDKEGEDFDIYEKGSDLITIDITLIS